MKFSIVIPTYNEEKDIAKTLDCLLLVEYPDKEIIVIDDSTDNTPKIVSNYKDKGVVLIHPKERMGRSEARNIGIRASTGDVIIILNADVIMHKQFIDEIKVHYERGYDSVTVFVEVANQESVYARYIELWTKWEEERGEYEERKVKNKGIYWSEGFSVKKSVLMKTSLFPTNFSVPMVAGEDVRLADELRELGCKGIIDTDIKIQHIAPDNLQEYWKIRKGRGAGTPQVRRFIHKWSYSKIFFIAVLKSIKRIVQFVTIIPMLKHNYYLAKFSEHNRLTETLKLSWCWMVEQAAFSVGEFQSLFKIIIAEKK